MKKNILILLLMKIAFGVIPLQSAEMDPIDGIDEGLPYLPEAEGARRILLNCLISVAGNERAEMADESSARKFKCETCSKGFTQKSDLKRHKRVHTGEKPYLCQFCNKGFTQNGHLTLHKRTHTGDKPYLCQFCNKGFADKSNLKRHEITQHFASQASQADEDNDDDE